jgi:hypothetical protein
MRIGLAVGERTVRAVGIRGSAVQWAFEGELDEGESFAAAIAGLLQRAPLPRWPRPVLVAAIGPSRAQFRQLPELPPVKDRRALSALLQEGSSRFFLRNGGPVVTSEPSSASVDGAPWAAAFDRPVIDDIAAACRIAAVRFVVALPAVAVLGRVLAREQVSWSDGDTVAECRYVDGLLVDCRRRWENAADRAGSGWCENAGVCIESDGAVPAGHSAADDQPPASPSGALLALGPGALRFADAYGAAISPVRAAFTYRPAGDPHAAEPVARWRLALAAAVLALSIASALAAPEVRDARTIAHATARLSALGPDRLEAARLERELALVSAALDDVARFADGRQSSLAILAALADSLPDGSALVMFRLDSLAGTAVVLAPRMAAVVGAMDRLPMVTSVEISGPVTRETMGERALERATLRFTSIRPPSDSPDRATSGREEAG